MDVCSVSLTLWFLSFLIFVLHSFSKDHCSALSSEFLQLSSAYFIPKVPFFFFLLPKHLFCSCLIAQSKTLDNFIYTVSSSHSWTAILAFSSSHCCTNLAGFCSLQPFGSFSCLVQLCCWQPQDTALLKSWKRVIYDSYSPE